MMRFLKNSFLVFLFLIPAVSFAQGMKGADTNLKHIQKFIAAVNNPEIATDVVLNQYVKINKELTDEYLDYLMASLDEVRLNIQMKNPDDIQYINFNQLPRKETRDIDVEDKDPNNMFFLKVKDRLVVALYLEEDKIASFTLVSKGNKVAHFVTY